MITNESTAELANQHNVLSVVPLPTNSMLHSIFNDFKEAKTLGETPGETPGEIPGETEKDSGESFKGETEKPLEEALEWSEETWKSMEETSALLVESMQKRLEATKEADWRWIEFC